MRFQEAIKEAVACVDRVGKTWYVLRRGNQFKVSSIDHRGWKVVEMIGPGNVANYREAQ